MKFYLQNQDKSLWLEIVSPNLRKKLYVEEGDKKFISIKATPQSLDI